MNTRQEAINKGIPLAPPKNDKHRRAPWHDYRLPGLYMLTVVTLNRQRLLGRLVTSPRPKIDLSPLGLAILSDEIKKITHFYPNVKVWKVCIMPDHIHMIVNVCEAFAVKKHLGSVITGFKTGCNRAYRRIWGIKEGSMFEPHYHDRILLSDMQYEGWKQYLDDNPRRLAIKHLHPEYFTTRYSLPIGTDTCQVFGNLFLLDIPDKMEVIVHRHDSDEEYTRKYNEWMSCGERGGVLVSAAIALRERAVINDAKARGYRVIELCDNGFGPLHKPWGADFDACAAGLLLQVSPWEYRAAQTRITRAQCLHLNALASRIAGGQDSALAAQPQGDSH